LLHVILMGDADWDPGVLDLDLDEQEAWFDTITDLPPDKPPSTLMSLVTTTREWSCRAMMSCTAGTPHSISLMPVR